MTRIRRHLLAFLVTVMFPPGAMAYIDPQNCIVDPWDTYGHLFLAPGNCTDDRVTITVRDHAGVPVAGARVAIDLSHCPGLCPDPVANGLSGATGPTGAVTLNPDVGGCANCYVVIRANNVPIRTFSSVVSPDLNADGAKDFEDIVWYVEHQDDPCTDFNGSGGRDVADGTMANWGILCAQGAPCSGFRPAATICHTFDARSDEGWGPCPDAPNVEFSIVGSGQAGYSDYFLRTRDTGGPSQLCASSELLGIYSGGCYRLSFDMRIIDDTSDIPLNPWPVPFVRLIGASGVTGTFVFNSDQYITDADGPRPGWHHFEVPIRRADPQGNLPSSAVGNWTVSPAGASNWNALLDGVAAMAFRVDIVGVTGELIGYDNFCVESTCSLASVSGVKFEDKNGNGRRDPGEPGVPGWPIALYSYAAGSEIAVTTDAEGRYLFEDLAPGEFLLREFPREGWEQTAPPEGAYALTLGPGQVFFGFDFGNQLQLVIHEDDIFHIGSNAEEIGAKLLQEWPGGAYDCFRVGNTLRISPRLGACPQESREFAFSVQEAVLSRDIPYKFSVDCRSGLYCGFAVDGFPLTRITEPGSYYFDGITVTTRIPGSGGGRKNPGPQSEQPGSDFASGEDPGASGPWIRLRSAVAPTLAQLGLEIGSGGPGRLELALFDPLGRRVAILFDGEAPEGGFTWVGGSGVNPAPGVYWLRASRGGQTTSARVLLVD